MPKYPSRRSFFTTAAAGAAAGGAMAVSPGTAHAQRKRYKRSSPSSPELMEIGMITTGGYSHADVWAKAMNPPLEERNGDFLPRTTGMVVTMAWDPNPEYVASFAKRFGVKTVKNFDDMVGKVDGVIISDYDVAGWLPQLTKPYLEAGMPFLIERPMALSLREANEIIERSKKYDAPIYVPSAFETRMETIRTRARLKTLIDGGARIHGVLASQGANDYPAHGTHGIYRLHHILEPDVISVSLQTDSWWGKKSLMTWKCRQPNGPDYFVALQMINECRTQIFTTKGTLEEHIDLTTKEQDFYTRSKWHNYPNMYEFAKMVETRKMPQSHDKIMSKTRTLLTGWYSHLEKGGAMVNCADLPVNWRGPDRFPGDMPKQIPRHRDPKEMDAIFG
jgi:hypothetical protein